MSAQQLRKLGGGEIPGDLCPPGWLEWCEHPELRVNLNRASVCVDSRNVGGWGRQCLFIASGAEYVSRGYRYQNEYRKERINGRPVRVYIGADEPITEAIPF